MPASPLEAYRDALHQFVSLCSIDSAQLMPPHDRDAQRGLVDMAFAMIGARRALADSTLPLSLGLALHIDSVSAVQRAILNRAGHVCGPVAYEPDGDETEERKVFDGDDESAPPRLERLPVRTRPVYKWIFRAAVAIQDEAHATPEEARAVANALRAVEAALTQERETPERLRPAREEDLSTRDRLILAEDCKGTKFTTIARLAKLSESGVRNVIKRLRSQGFPTRGPRR